MSYQFYFFSVFFAFFTGWLIKKRSITRKPFDHEIYKELDEIKNKIDSLQEDFILATVDKKRSGENPLKITGFLDRKESLN